MKKNNKIATIILIVALIIDQITKIIAYAQGKIIDIESSENSGYYIIMSIIVVILIIRYMSNDNSYIKLGTRSILGLAMAGIIGNTIDRIWYKNVIVFISLRNGFNINFAYLYILVAWFGMAGLLTKNTMEILRERKIKKEYEKDRSKRESSRKKD